MVYFLTESSFIIIFKKNGDNDFQASFKKCMIVLLSLTGESDTCFPALFCSIEDAHQSCSAQQKLQTLQSCVTNSLIWCFSFVIVDPQKVVR